MAKRYPIFCPTCNVRHTHFGLVPVVYEFKHHLEKEIDYLQITCGKCFSYLFKGENRFDIEKVENFFWKGGFDEDDSIIGFGQYRHSKINEVPRDYLEFVLIEQNKPLNEKRYEVGFNYRTQILVERFLGKWWNYVESRWIELPPED